MTDRAAEVAELLHGARKEYRLAAIETLHPNPWNPNVMDEATYRAERESIRIYGFIDPCTVRPHPEIDGDWQILDGEHRWKAAKDEGHTELDMIVLHGLSDGQAQKLTIILNETRGSADEAKMAQLLKRLDSEMSREELLAGLSYENDDLERMIARASFGSGAGEGIDLEDVPETPQEPVSKRGEVYELGPHRLMCGDSADWGDIDGLMSGHKAHMVMADPPYNVGYTGGSSNRQQRDDAYEDDRGTDYGPWLTQVLTNGASVSDDEAALHLWFAINEMDAICHALETAGWIKRTMVVWGKSHSTGQGFAQYKAQFEQFWYAHKKGKSPRWYGPTTETTLWTYDKPGRSELHPVMRPVEMYVREIVNHTQPGHSVLELFGGSGTTLMAAEVSQRRAFLMEIEPKFCDVIRERYARYEQAKTNMEWSGAAA